MTKFIKAVCLILATALFGAIEAKAEGQHAILIHNGETTVFSGASSLMKANEKAVDGDIITLSPGVYESISIWKSITIHGTGIEDNEKCSFIDNIAIGYDNSTVVRLEGLYIRSLWGDDRSTAIVNKCRLEEVPINSFGNNLYMKATHSLIGNIGVTRAELKNCVVSGYIGEEVNALNTVFLKRVPGHSELSNCICFDMYNWYSIAATNTIFIHSTDGKSDDNTPNKIFTEFNNSMLLHGTNCKLFPVDTPVFKADSELWELLDENAAAWLGTDGTQVGIHGGLMPFCLKPDMPRFSLIKIAEKTTVDGILDVEIRLED